MAGDWIKMEVATPDKPEVLAITAKMGWDDPDLAVGKLFRIWRWFDQHTADGNAEGVTKTVLDRIVGVTGFAEAMESVGWLSVNEAGISLPNFTKHCGITAKSRAETARRVAKHRDKAAPSEPNKRVVLPRPLRKAILERDGAKCVYCGRQEGEYAPPETAQDALLCLDHVIPVARGGTDDLANLVCACSSCNRFKSDRTPDECGLAWPLNEAGERMGNAARVTGALPREEKRRSKPTCASGDARQPERAKTSESFEQFWAAYPKRKSRGHAEKAFAKINPDEQLLQAMVASIERAKTSDDWRKDGGQYVPYPATWLNAKGWEDEIAPRAPCDDHMAGAL